MTAAGEAAVIGERLGKSHADASAERGCHADQKSVPGIAGGECGSEDRCERRDGAIHQTGQAGLHNLQNEKPAARPFFILRNIGAQFFFFQLLGAVFVSALFLGQVVEQLADAGILSSSRSLLVEPASFYLDGAGFVAHDVKAERPSQPDRLSLYEAFHVMAADEWNMFAEFLPVQVDQSSAMSGFFSLHPFKYGGRSGEVLAQSFGEIGEDALIFFFERNGQGEDLALVKSFESLHG